MASLTAVVSDGVLTTPDGVSLIRRVRDFVGRSRVLRPLYGQRSDGSTNSPMGAILMAVFSEPSTLTPNNNFLFSTA